MIRNALLIALALVGCSDDVPRGAPAQTTFSVSNETLVFPLTSEPRPMTAEAPGALVQKYTRVGCWISDPGAWIDRGTLAVPATAPVHLTRITIEQVAKRGTDATALAERTCFTYRSVADGAWHALLPPSRIVVDGPRAIAEIELDVADVDAAAIFLHTWTDVARVEYAVR